MATFNIKRGDSMPPLQVALRVAGSDPENFWNYEADDVGGTTEDNGGDVGIKEVRVIIKNMETGKMVGLPAFVAQGFSGYGVYVQKTVGYFDPPANTQPIIKTILRYNWQPPSVGFDPANPVDGEYAGDTGTAGVYQVEFEVVYQRTFESGDASQYKERKRTFPVTPGDVLIVNVTQDTNDKQPSESV